MYRFIIITIIALFLFVSDSKAQEMETDSVSNGNTLAMVDLMLFGCGVYVEPIMSDHFSFRLGANYVYVNEDIFGASIPIMFNYFTSRYSGLEAGFGIGYFSGKSGLSPGGGYHKFTGYLPALSLGYRYYSKETHRLLRIGLELPANFCYMLHLSFGFSF